MRGKDKNEEKNVIVEVEYGNIKVKLDDILNEKGISTYELSSRANVRFQTVKTLRSNTASRIDFEVLAKICYVLSCKVEDIIEYVDENDRK